jgi:hypothetical protein
MSVVSAGSQRPWTVASDDLCMALEVVLLKRTIVLSWGQFIYAEGSDEEVRLAFSSHDVIVRGTGLAPLLSDVSAQRVTEIREPVRAECFPGVAARFIREVEVRRIDAN